MKNGNEPIRIAYLTTGDPQDRRPWSGIVYYIAQALQKHCGEVSYVDLTPHYRTVELTKRVIRRSSRILLRKNYYGSILVSKINGKLRTQNLAGQSFDVIVAPGYVEDIAFLETNIPILHVGDATLGSLIDYYPWYSNLTNRAVYELQTIQKLALQKASAVVYPSTWAARSAIEDYGTDPRKVHVVPLGANLDESPPREIALTRRKSDRCRLLFLGVEWQRKGGDIAFETLLKLEDMGIAAEIIVCGCTPPETFMHEHMTVIPFLNKNDARQRRELEMLLVQADFLFLPTRSECYGLVFCEANAFGLPIIATNTGGISEIVRGGENGFLLPYEARGAEYAEMIASIYRDDESYAQLVRTSRAAFETRLNWDVWGIAMKQIVTDLLDHGNSSGDSLLSTSYIETLRGRRGNR